LFSCLRINDSKLQQVAGNRTARKLTDLYSWDLTMSGLLGSVLIAAVSINFTTVQ